MAAEVVGPARDADGEQQKKTLKGQKQQKQ